MSSQLNVDTIADKAGSGPVGLTKQHAAKVWVNYSSSTTIRDSFGISNLVDDGTGDYTANFSVTFANDDFEIQLKSGKKQTLGNQTHIQTPTSKPT